MESKDYLKYIKDKADASGHDYKEVLRNYKAMLKANFEQDIHDIINSMEGDCL